MIAISLNSFLLMGLTVSLFGILTAICLPNTVTYAQTTSQVNITEALIDNYPYISVEFEDPSTVVIRGDEEELLLVNGTLAPFWEAIDKVKEQGYKLDDIATSGMGSQGNPTRFYAAMSK
jgi:hypothetical protein